MSANTGRTAAAAPPLVSCVVAVAENGVIGRDNGLPWHLPADLRRFKALTMGKPMLMGRRTWESIGRPLPGRRSLVLTRAAGWRAAGAEGVHSLGEALAAAGDAPELVVIGGAEVFRQALPLARRVYLTIVHAHVEGDVRLEPFEERAWHEIERSEHPADERHAYAMTFRTLERADA